MLSLFSSHAKANEPLSRPRRGSSKASRHHALKRRSLGLQSLERRQLLAAEVLEITVENLADEGGLAATPFWVAAHDGNFDLANAGQPASDFGGLELIAEEGDPSELAARFAAEGNGNAGVVFAPEGFAGAPVFEPGEIASLALTVDDTTEFQYFSFASMVIPSNDAFIANFNPQAFRLFDSFGDFLGPQTIVIYGSQVWDAGTEVNDPAGGAAFASAGGTSTDQNGVIALHEGLDNFVGAGLPTGSDLEKAFGANTPIARITIARQSAPSNPIDQNGPRVSFSAADLNTRADFHEISVTYSDPSGIDITSIDTNDVRITGPLLTTLDVISVSTDAVAGQSANEVTATYRVAPASGSFTSLDNGTYSVVLLGDQVNDPFAQAADAQLLGDFTVDAPVQIQVTFENLAQDGGLAQTPLWIASHDGNFQVARAGESAALFGGLELIAEEGDASELAARFAAESSGSASLITAPDGFPGAPVFEPGETVTGVLDIADPLGNRFFSYASMIIPSNDAFIANLDPRAIELFDRFGQFTGSRTITIYGQDVWDAGTEVNDPSGGAAFSTEGGTSVDEGGVIRRHDGLDDFIGTGLPTGGNLESAFDNMTPIGRITISLTDLPAEPIDNRGPLVNADITNATVAGALTHEIHVTYSDASGIDLSSIDLADIDVTSTSGNVLQVVGVTTDAVAGQSSPTVTATYQVAPVDGDAFSTFDNGLYIVSLNAGEVTDTLGNSNGVTALGTFEVQVAVEIEVTVENLAVDGGLYQTPFWIGVHDGNFSVARSGASASQFGGLELIAEEGDVSELVARFLAESSGSGGVVLSPDGFPGAPVFGPGEIASQTLQVFDTNANRFFSFASMIIPSNDAFIANLNPRGHELFDESGFFLGEQTITIFGRDVLDSGTEVNAVDGGAAFSTVGGTSIDENGVIRRHDGLDDFIGSGLPTGEDLASAFSAATPLARITIGLAGAGNRPADNEAPTASLTASSVTVAGTETHQIQVTYNDPAGVDLTTISVDDLIVSSGPVIGGVNSRLLEVVDAVADAPAGTAPRSVTVTYTLATPDGPFTARDNGRYDVVLADNSVGDTLGQTNSGAAIGTFAVDVGIRLQVEVASLTPAGGLLHTPFWVGFHNGEFEVARSGLPAAQFGGLELIAEEGDPSELVARFAAESTGTDTVITAPDGFAGAPVFEPGEIASQVIEVGDTTDNRYFSFASMVIPSNDAFVGNLDSLRYELFDALGNFRGERQITIYGREVLDAGTEVNSVTGGAAFSTEGGTSVDEGGVIRTHAGLDEFIGSGLPTGATLESAFGLLTPLATITVSLFDPEPVLCSGVDGACSVRSVSLQNANLSADVNRDGEVSALDALLVVNFLGRFGNQSTISDEAQRTGLDLDVGGDTEISSMDALLVINELARRNSLLANGEQIGGFGEVSETFDNAIDQLTSSGSPLGSAGFSDGLDDDELENTLSLLF